MNIVSYETAFTFKGYRCVVHISICQFRALGPSHSSRRPHGAHGPEPRKVNSPYSCLVGDDPAPPVKARASAITRSQNG